MKLDNTWFFKDTNPLFKFLMIYIRGDILILLPLVLLIGLIGLFSLRFMLVVAGLYAGFRGLIEMIYWLLQQFGDRKYRPYDYGLKNLDNHAIYIIYQTTSLISTILGFSLVAYSVLYLYLER